MRVPSGVAVAWARGCTTVPGGSASVRAMVPCAYLRAFEPLDAFPAQERERWSSYVAQGEGVSRPEAIATEEAVSTSRLLHGRFPDSQDDLALVRRVGQRVHLCPLQLDLRAAAALNEFRRSVPDVVADAFLPDERARRDLERLARSGRTPHTLDAPWALPLHWFVAFDPDDRHLVDPPEGRGPRIVHLTTADQAAQRLSRAIEIVEATLEDGEEVLAALADVAAWIDGFDERTIIELDYGGITRLLDPAQLERDHTCEDVWNALESLGDGDLLGAAAYYGVARSRWSSLRHKQHAS